MPNTKLQSVLIYALNALLLFNLTVIIVMLAGTGPEKTALAEKPSVEPAAHDAPQHRHAPFAPAREDETLVETQAVSTPATAEPAEAHATVEPVAEAQPIVRIEQVSSEVPAVPIAPQPIEQDDTPIQFFGVGLD